MYLCIVIQIIDAMAAKRMNETKLTIEVKGKTLTINAYVTKIRSGYCEVVEYNGVFGKYPYGNRPWEAFKYEIAIKQLGEKLGYKREFEKWCENQIKKSQEETRRFLGMFDAAYSNLTDKQKKAFADSDIHVETPEQANVLLLSVQMAAFINE